MLPRKIVIARNALSGKIGLCLLLACVVCCPAFSHGSESPPSGKIIKDILLSKLRYTDEKIVRDALKSNVGEPFVRQTVEDDVERLDRLGVFSEINIRSIVEEDGVVLSVEVKETFPYMPMVSVEVNDENGVSVGPGLKAVNLFRRGIFFSGAARFGGATTLEFNLENRKFGKHHLFYKGQYFYRRRWNSLYDFEEHSNELNIRFGKYLTESTKFGCRFAYLSLESDRPGIALSTYKRDDIPTLGVFFDYDTRDLWSNPQQGWWNEIEIVKNGGFLGGDYDYWAFTFDIRRFQPIVHNHILAFFSLATLQSGEVSRDLPEYMAFHIGGTNTIRGWELGSRHGKNQWINTVEYRYTFLPPRALTFFGITVHFGLQAALFTDFGIAWDRKNEFALSDFIDGYGVGLRLLVPYVNIIRLDLGFGQPGGGIRFHIGIMEKAEMQRARVR